MSGNAHGNRLKREGETSRPGVGGKHRNFHAWGTTTRWKSGPRERGAVPALFTFEKDREGTYRGGTANPCGKREAEKRASPRSPKKHSHKETGPGEEKTLGNHFETTGRRWEGEKRS